MLLSYYQNKSLSDYVREVLENNETDFMVSGEPLIVVLAKENELAQIKTLVEGGFDIDAESINPYTKGNTALIEASYRGYEDIVAYLIEHEASINHANYMGNTPLMMAVLNKKEAIVDLLIKASACVNQSDINGMTPLMIACGKGYYGVVERLIEAGADQTLVDDDGDDALKLAYQHGDYQIIELLKRQQI